MKSLRILLVVLGLAAGLSARAEQFKALLFSKTAGWHHESINAGVTAIRQLGQLHDFEVFWTEDANRVMNDKELAKYKVVIFLCTTGDILNDEQQAAFERFIKAGGGFVGIHSATDTEYSWDWYAKLVGYNFRAHPPVQTATVKVLDPNFPGLERFARRFLWTEEWYEFSAPKSDGLHFLLAVDESTYNPATKNTSGMGDFHPVAWYHEYDGGRAFYTALGHLPGSYSDAAFLHHIYGGIYWAATGRTFKAE